MEITWRDITSFSGDASGLLIYVRISFAEVSVDVADTHIIATAEDRQFLSFYSNAISMTSREYC